MAIPGGYFSACHREFGRRMWVGSAQYLPLSFLGTSLLQDEFQALHAIIVKGKPPFLGKVCDWLATRILWPQI